MAQRHTPLTNGLHDWLAQFTDTADWGYMSTRDGVLTGNTSERLEGALAKTCWPARFAKRMTKAHLDGGFTAYYRCRRSASVHPLMIDVDAHNGEDDALDLAMHMLALFPGSYLEPSTHGQGFHIYVHVAVGSTPRKLFNGLVRVLEQSLQAIASENRYKAQVEVKGLCTLLEADKLHIVKRGSLAKIPRLAKGEQDLVALLASPTFDLAHVRRVVDQAPPDLGLICDWLNVIMDHYHLAKYVPAHLVCDGDDKVTDQGFAPMREYKPNGSVSQISEWAAGTSNNPDARARMREAALVLARSLGRVPSVEELEAFYVAQGLNTGEAKGNNRAKRAKDVLKFVAKTFDPALASGGGYVESVPVLLEAIRQHVKPEHRLDVCYPRRITDEDIAVGLYAVERGSFRGHFECGNKSIQNMFVTLKADGVFSRSCNRNKAVSIKVILERAGLIRCHNAHYTFGPDVMGKSKEYVIGANHPRFAEFEATQEKPVQVQVKVVVDDLAGELLPDEVLDGWMDDALDFSGPIGDTSRAGGGIVCRWHSQTTTEQRKPVVTWRGSHGPAVSYALIG